MAVRWRTVVSLTPLLCTLTVLGTIALYFNYRELHTRMLTIESFHASSLTAGGRQDYPGLAIDKRQAVALVQRLVQDQLRFNEQSGEEFAFTDQPGEKNVLHRSKQKEKNFLLQSNRSEKKVLQKKPEDKEAPDLRKNQNEKVSLKKNNQDKSEEEKWRQNVDKKEDDQVSAQEAEADVKELLSRPILNEFNISYIYANDKMCSEEDMEVLFIIPSGPKNIERRIWVRNGTQMAYAKNVTNKARAVFFMGLPHKRSDVSEKTAEQLALEQEAKLHGDIVLVDFEDIYKNILVKHMSMLKWALSYCSQTKFVIRTDDDVLVDPAKLIAVVRRYQLSHDNFILGRRRVNAPVYRGTVRKKAIMSIEEYAPDVYPPFVLGGCIGYPLTTVHLLYEAAQRIKTIWLDDVFVTGICAQKLHIQSFMERDFNFMHWSKKGWRFLYL